jgi:hypothetical protein
MMEVYVLSGRKAERDGMFGIGVDAVVGEFERD